MKGTARPPLPKRGKTPTTSKLKAKLWGLCRDLIRERYGNTCYTCGTTGLEGSNWQTGHFIPSSICSMELRFDLDNLRPQCMPCNVWKSGAWPDFERHLIADHGAAYVKKLKERNQKTKGKMYGTPWLLSKIEEYKALSGAKTEQNVEFAGVVQW